MRNVDPFEDMGTQLQELQARREQIALKAFSVLEERLADFSSMLVIGLGDRTRAVLWMCMRHRSLEGRNAYQVIADGEKDRLWEILESLCSTQEA
ncbi:DUF2384 domain-containing protein [Dyella caseinilytica]|uniref:DUF2384 domain-containing protein n=1 Tax=Dyella caseinilytica TaxID=1849581 RepID=A0ABX7GZS7_9GAMM|nr:DUF2384 domain-containing protein [Dyella caseinilytica]QRN55528.1 DUF2384 domain-containing protein [Dyella caseinilytica]GGA02451.1 hypothetical protein GCM10011408_24830 [Dyella caseinilytica]